jgi:hypothetical protein
MEDQYAEYKGKIVQIRKKGWGKDHADICGRVSSENDFSLELGKNTYYYDGDTDGIVASRIRIAEMGYHIHHNLVYDIGFIDRNEIDKIKVLASD